MNRRLLALGALLCALPWTAAAQQVPDSAANAVGTYRQTVPSVQINPTCNAGGPGVVGLTYGGTLCPAPGGSGGGGAVTEADGANIALGAKADAASATGSQSLISIIKQLHADLLAPTPAGSAVIGGVTQSGTWAVNSTLQAGTANIGSVTGWVGNVESLVPLAAGGNITTTGRTCPAWATRFNAAALSDQSGTMFIRGTQDGTNFYILSSTAAAGGGGQASAFVTLTGLGRYQVYYANGATAQALFNLSTSCTAN